ncbi:LysR family transcriptional regulator [Rhodococcus koreensis]|uniref:LysR family transcriptional regulator n=1 Tax=Rhodococcus koreensis TaxID=99653 RepID=UPI00197E8D7D|nr:LysR family transcriptional regulator [Rhodococcus koreensis]QSE82486.1 LysR family transcriptional regulator [Rhodococcus koreensis]
MRMKLNRIDLNLLVGLDALLSERSVSRAAKQLSVGQPAMSGTLSRLRKLFNDPLLVRDGSSMTLTPLAESLTYLVHDILGSIETLVTVRAPFDAASDTRTFTIHASDYVTLVLLRSFVRAAAGEAPNVRINIAPPQTNYFDPLLEARADLVIIPREIVGHVGTAYASAPLFMDRHVCVVAADHPVVGETMSREQFSAFPHLSATGGIPPSFAETQFDEISLPFRIEASTTSYVAAPFLLEGTEMVAVLYERLARALHRSAGIRLLEPPVSLAPITEMMYWHPRHSDDPGHRWLRHGIRRLAEQL